MLGIIYVNYIQRKRGKSRAHEHEWTAAPPSPRTRTHDTTLIYPRNSCKSRVACIFLSEVWILDLCCTEVLEVFARLLSFLVFVRFFLCNLKRNLKNSPINKLWKKQVKFLTHVNEGALNHGAIHKYLSSLLKKYFYVINPAVGGSKRLLL